MKLKDLTEAYISRFSATDFLGKTFNDGEIFKNPTRREVKYVESSFEANDDLPGFIHLETGDLYVFRPYSLHYKVASSGKIPSNSIGVRIYHDESECELTVTDFTKRSSWNENPEIEDAIRRSYLSSLYQIRDIHYYNEDIVGDWSELDQ